MKLTCASFLSAFLVTTQTISATSLNFDSSNNYSQLESEVEMMPGMGPPANPPVPCSAAGHMNTPVVNIINKSQETQHSHAYDPPKKG